MNLMNPGMVLGMEQGNDKQHEAGDLASKDHQRPAPGVAHVRAMGPGATLEHQKVARGDQALAGVLLPVE